MISYSWNINSTFITTQRLFHFCIRAILVESSMLSLYFPPGAVNTLLRGYISLQLHDNLFQSAEDMRNTFKAFNNVHMRVKMATPAQWIWKLVSNECISWRKLGHQRWQKKRNMSNVLDFCMNNGYFNISVGCIVSQKSRMKYTSSN